MQRMKKTARLEQAAKDMGKGTTLGETDMNIIERNRIDQIVSLHGEIEASLRTTVGKAIEIGGLLEDQKQELPHGEWGRWAQQNLPFTLRTATNYMNCFRHRDRLKSESVSDLASAYKLLTAPSETPVSNETRLDQYARDICHVFASAEADLQAVLATEAQWREHDAALSAQRPKDAHERALIEELQRTVREGLDLVEQAKECQRGMAADTGQVEGGN